jgi:hypothetical protein
MIWKFFVPKQVPAVLFFFRSPIKYFPSFEKKASIPEMGPFSG